jgi:hypothetical protein
MRKGPSKAHCHLFHGQLRDLKFDPNQWSWVDGTPLLDYMAKKGWKMINMKDSLMRKIQDKCPNLFTPTYNIK